MNLKEIEERIARAKEEFGESYKQDPEQIWLIAEVEALREWVNDLQSEMYINCVYCGHRYGPNPGTPIAMADVLREHIEKCPKHPLSHMKARAEKAEAEVERLQNDLADALDWREGKGPTVFDMLQRKADYQRRHRKWALKQARRKNWALRQTRDVLQSLNQKRHISEARAEKAEAELQNLTPGGSEFQLVEECVRWIRDRLSTRAKQAIENRRLTERVRDWKDVLEMCLNAVFWNKEDIPNSDVLLAEIRQALQLAGEGIGVPLREILDWYMCSDPWPVDDRNQGTITAWLEAECKARGYPDWVEAYHRLPAEVQHKEGE